MGLEKFPSSDGQMKDLQKQSMDNGLTAQPAMEMVRSALCATSATTSATPMDSVKSMTTNISDKPHYHVVIATPGKLMHSEFVNSLVETTRWLTSEGLDYKFLSSQSSFVPSAREQTALNSHRPIWDTREIGAGEFTYDKIFWIDSDVEWDVEDFVRIYQSDLDVVSGLYQTSPDGTVAVARFDDDMRPKITNELDFFMEEEPVEVFGVGFGFVAMKSGVFEKCDRPWFLMERIRWQHLDFDLNVGEDYSFCVNARRNGFKVWLDADVKLRHHKETIYAIR
jgi:hypothetical protein